MPSVTVQTDGGTYTVENADVQNVADLLTAIAPTLGIPASATAQVNGRPATGRTRLNDRDEVAFTKAAGAKGVEKVIVIFRR